MKLIAVLLTFISLSSFCQNSDTKTDSTYKKLEAEGFPIRTMQTKKPLFYLVESSSAVSANGPVIVLRQKEIDQDKVNNINPENIESINVLKGKQATDSYGEKGENGVVVIKLKKGVKVFDE